MIMLARTLRIATAIAAIAASSSLVAAQTPTFVRPSASVLTTLTEGQEYVVSWLAPFISSTLQVYQGPLDNGQFVYETLATNMSISDTSYTWTANPLPEANLNGEIVFFRLVNEDDRSDTTDSGNVELLASNGAASSSATVNSSTITPAAAVSSSSVTESPTTGGSVTAVVPITAAANSSSLISSASMIVPSINTSMYAPTTMRTSASGASASAFASTFRPANSTNNATSTSASTPASPGGGTGLATTGAGTSNKNYLGSYLGVGLGVGIPVVVGVAAALVFMSKQAGATGAAAS